MLRTGPVQQYGRSAGSDAPTVKLNQRIRDTRCARYVWPLGSWRFLWQYFSSRRRLAPLHLHLAVCSVAGIPLLCCIAALSGAAGHGSLWLRDRLRRACSLITAVAALRITHHPSRVNPVDDGP